MKIKRSTLKKLIKALLLITIYLGFNYFAYIPLNYFGIDTPNIAKGSTNIQIIYKFIVESLFILVVVFTYKDDFKKNLKNFFQNKKKYIIQILIAYILITVLNSLTAGIINNFIPMSVKNQKILELSIHKAPIYMFFYIILYTAIIENIIFKKIFSDFIKNKWLFIIIASSIYGYFNIAFVINSPIEYLTAIPYIVSSVIACYIYKKNNNIIQLITLNAFSNLIFYILFL